MQSCIGTRPEYGHSQSCIHMPSHWLALHYITRDSDRGSVLTDGWQSPLGDRAILCMEISGTEDQSSMDRWLDHQQIHGQQSSLRNPSVLHLL
jgi:hypothetical protein